MTKAIQNDDKNIQNITDSDNSTIESQIDPYQQYAKKSSR